MKRLIIISITLLTTLCTGLAVYFFLKVQATNQQLALINGAPNHIVDVSLMNKIALDFHNSLDLWESILLISSVVLMLVLNLVFRSKSEN